jgi:hypothetical protein
MTRKSQLDLDLQALKQEYKQNILKAISTAFMPIFSDHPEVEVISWDQQDDYYNDEDYSFRFHNVLAYSEALKQELKTDIEETSLEEALIDKGYGECVGWNSNNESSYRAAATKAYNLIRNHKVLEILGTVTVEVHKDGTVSYLGEI